MTGNTRPPPAKTDAEREAILRLYVDGQINAGEAADRLGPRTAISEVILEARERFNRLPDRQDAFTEGEFRRALKMLGLADRVR